MKKEWTQSLHFSSFRLHWTLPKLKIMKIYSEKLLAIGICKCGKIKTLSPLPSSGKIRLLFAPFTLFLALNRAGLQVKGWGPKFNVLIHQNDSSSTSCKKQFRFQHFPVLQLRAFQKKINLDFQVWLLILVFLLDAEFNAESIGTHFKSQKLKTKKLVFLFLIAHFILR